MTTWQQNAGIVMFALLAVIGLLIVAAFIISFIRTLRSFYKSDHPTKE